MKLLDSVAHLFTPRHTNNHKAKILHSSSIFVLCLSLIFAQLVITGLTKIPAQKGKVLGFVSQISKEDVITLTNQKRAESGLPPLKENEALMTGAQAKGQNMIALGYWAHVAPDGTQPWKFFTEVGYKYRYAGENLARDFSSASAAMDAWMASPSHRENMLSPKYTDIGIGVVDGNLAGSDTTIIVQFFGTLMSTTPQIQQIAAANVSQTPVPTQIAQQQAVAGTQVVSPFITTKNLSALLVVVLLIAFIIDVVVISRRRITRISGRSWAHVAFLGMTLAIVLIIQAGKIL